MSYQEIIEKLKKVFDCVDDFAYEEIPYPENYSEAALKAQAEKDKFYEEKLKPVDRNTPEYTKLYEQYLIMPSKYDVAKNEWKENVGLNWEEIDQYGGEGQGDTWYSVKYFPDDDVYIKVNGFYSSYNGTDFDGWEDCQEVRPIEKTITVYE